MARRSGIGHVTRLHLDLLDCHLVANSSRPGGLTHPRDDRCSNTLRDAQDFPGSHRSALQGLRPRNANWCSGWGRRQRYYLPDLHRPRNRTMHPSWNAHALRRRPRANASEALGGSGAHRNVPDYSELRCRACAVDQFRCVWKQRYTWAGSATFAVLGQPMPNACGNCVRRFPLGHPHDAIPVVG